MKSNTHRPVLDRVFKWGRIAGWGVILIGLFETCAYAYAHLAAHVSEPHTLYQSMTCVGNIFVGLLVLITIRFVRYVVEENTEPGWLLRNSSVIVGLFALYVLTTGGLYAWAQFITPIPILLNHSRDNMIPLGKELAVTTLALIAFLPPAAKSLCVLGIAAMLRKVLPVLTESKTLA